MEMVAQVSGLLLACVALREAARRTLGVSGGVDRWYWKAYTEAVDRTGRIPPELPQYLLDEAQWYPPVYPRFLTRLPARFIEAAEPWLGIAFDVARLGLLLLAARALELSATGVLAAGLVFVSAPILVVYNVQSNPRAPGALLLELLVLLVLALLAGQASPWAWVVVGLLGGLVALTHKMTTQMMWVLCLGGALALGDPRLAALGLLTPVLAWVMSGGFYKKVLRAHWDIVRFWNRNWPWLQADPVRESPVYGQAGYVTPTKLHLPGARGVARHLRGLLRNLPAAWLVPALWVTGLAGPMGGAERFIAGWFAVEFGFAIATTFVGPLKCLGGGVLYLYNAAFPAALWYGLAVSGAAHRGSLAAFAGVAVTAQLAVVTALLILGARRGRRALEPDWDATMSFLRNAPRGVVLCLPQNLHDEVAYRTGQPVLFGGHGYGFEKLEPVFPRLLLSVREMKARYGLRYVLAKPERLSEKLQEELLNVATEKDFGTYRVFVLA